MNEIGERLKEARKAKGYTLDDLQQKTKIQKRYLIAVEEGNLDVLPGNFYARAFIKQYADSVGLNGDELIREHMDTLPQTNNASYSENVQKNQTRSKSKNSGFLATLKDSLPTLLIVLLVIAIIFAIYLAVTLGDDDDSNSFINEDESSEFIEVDDNEEEIEQTEEPADEEADDEQAVDGDTDEDEETGEDSAEEQALTFNEISSTGAATTFSVSGSRPPEQTIVLTAEGGQSWSSINVDGEMTQGLIEDGGSLSASVAENATSITMVIGNASVTTIELDDQEVPYNTSENEAVRQEVTLEFE